MRQKLRAAGCRCNLVSLARMPLLQERSWHHHFVGWKVPLCRWQPASDCATRMSLGLTCHEAPRVRHRHEGVINSVDDQNAVQRYVG